MASNNRRIATILTMIMMMATIIGAPSTGMWVNGWLMRVSRRLTYESRFREIAGKANL